MARITRRAAAVRARGTGAGQGLKALAEDTYPASGGMIGLKDQSVWDVQLSSPLSESASSKEMELPLARAMRMARRTAALAGLRPAAGWGVEVQWKPSPGKGSAE